MVHIKRVELSHFKSFGGTSQVPLLPGFTVISGPNGSGKSNILDALLFCLGLASSKGMRAERLPDLINHNHQTNRGTAEASVTVTFDLSDEPGFFAAEEQGSRGAEEQRGRGAEEQGSESTADTVELNGDGENSQSPVPSPQSPKEWSVTRKLRVTKQGSYSSTYFINGESCTLTELHEQLNRLRVYPEGYNVVLQGDVTSIISMNAKERREIIDELAGVAAFDRKISQAKETLESVKEREDSCRIVERELISQRDRLSQDRIKAEKYQKLRGELQEKEKWEVVLVWQTLRKQEWQLREQIALGDRNSIQLTEQLESLNQQIRQVSAELEELNAKVKALGEEELLALQAVLATQEAEKRQLQLRQTELTTSFNETEKRLRETRQEIEQHQQSLGRISQEQEFVRNELVGLVALRDAAQLAVNQSRESASAIASSSEAWVQQQTSLNRQVESLLEIIDPQRTEQAQLRERSTNLERLIEEQTQLLESLAPQLESKQSREVDFENQLQDSGERVQQLAERLSYAEQELKLQQDTQKRLSQEQREKQRQLDKLEAQQQAQQEAQGTYATKLILQSGMPGICGLVAQLGRAFPEYQLALETAAGARLGHLVVEDDGIAAAGIELLKQKKAGRVTFLPLNKIYAPKLTPVVSLRYANGFIDYAINLIECEPRYRDIFAYVFGSTIVFKTLSDARQFLGQYRIVTLEGELLEASGAMTGGSVSHSSGLHFGTGHSTESVEVVSLKNRLHDIELVLERCEESIGKLSLSVKQLTQELTEARQERREQELHFEQLKREINGLNEQRSQLNSQIAKNTLELSSAKSRLQILETELPANEANLAQLRQTLAELEQSQIHSEWQQMQATIKVQEAELNQREQNLRNDEQRLKDLENQSQLLQSRIGESQRRVTEYETQRNQQQEQLNTVSNQDLELNAKIGETQAAMVQAEAKLGEEKKTRDARENKLRQLQKSQQQTEWELQKLQETQAARREELTNVETQRQTQETELPEPLPTVPENTNLEELQKEIRAIQKRLQAMEPVNMLALEEYDRTQARLDELTEKLTTLEAERTELLLRIENFTTLRFRAFKEAFDAVNENFQTIFAELSEGDGSLTLDNPEDPFAGGLNLVAHPKGKPVQRLASMSGGEKSLTALSFIFALQRYRPSPFYSFDEVDMFLDGANVERLARMIRQQADRAQFIVVSHKGPMIKAAERVIGVTQARGAYTQVLGIKLQTAAKPN
ncbi:chromosome segregation protein SMC [Aerosakkonemataceae cyanobacterium BLCC-F154]|uniref:Chromosome partition protein Smc n=1 Tax=Floridaenema fluviatile BLCC-F154 TaxID=3153640 RepID=A0ABV4YIV3_9CYAN